MYLTSEFLSHQINDEALSVLGGVIRALSHAEIEYDDSCSSLQ